MPPGAAEAGRRAGAGWSRLELEVIIETLDSCQRATGTPKKVRARPEILWSTISGLTRMFIKAMKVSKLLSKRNFELTNTGVAPPAR